MTAMQQPNMEREPRAHEAPVETARHQQTCPDDRSADRHVQVPAQRTRPGTSRPAGYDAETLERYAPGHYGRIVVDPLTYLAETEPGSDVIEGVFDAVGTALVLPDVPRFGSREWLALPEDDYRREAATLRAATAWWAAENDLGAPASGERIAALVAEQLKAASSQIAGALREQGGQVGPGHNVIARRRDWHERDLGRRVTAEDARRSWADLDARTEAEAS